MAQLARPDEDMRGKLHRELGDQLSFVAVYGAEQLAHAHLVEDRAIMLDGGSRERPAQIPRGIGAKPRGREADPSVSPK